MTIDTIYEKIKDTFESESGETVTHDGDLGIRMRVIAGEIFNAYEQMEFYQKQILPQTASGDYLKRHAQTRDIVKKTAQAASGKIEFSRKTAAAHNMVIPVGTVVTSSGGGMITYVTTAEGILSAGTLSVLVPAQATAIGRETNMQAGKIDTLVSGLTGIDRVTNPESFTGGMEEEDDESLRRRLLESYCNPSNGANLKYYENFATSYNQVWSAKASFSTTENNLLNLYVSDIFRLTPQSLCDTIQTAIEQARELNIRVVVQKPQIIKQDIQATVYVRDLQNMNAQILRASSYIQDEIYKLGIGESLNPYTLARGMDVVMESFGDIVFTSPAGVIKISNNQILAPGNVNIKLERK